MCFSAQADVTAGVVIGLVGFDALRHVRNPDELAIAALPGLFGLHQITEAFVWWGLEGRVAWSTGRLAVWVYLVFALGVLPVLVPVAVRAVEPSPRRRVLLGQLGAGGAVVAAVYLTAMVSAPVTAAVSARHVVYHVDVFNPGLVAAVYVLIGCGAPLLSSHRPIVAFGVANAAAVVALLWLQSQDLTSLWCVWAAIASVAIAAHVRRSAWTRDPVPSSVAGRSA